MSSPSLHTLLPYIIPSDTPQHEAVDNLANALAQEGVKNIAITGAYGSGKSSVISTLISEHRVDNDSSFDKGNDNLIKIGKETKLKWCRISLATIEALDDIETSANKEEAKNDGKSQLDKKDEEKLNKRIEYSLLQQLLYKEGHKDLPKSRFKKIPFISKSDAGRLTIGVVAFIICWLIVFEPKAFRVDSLYSFFENNFGICNFIADILASLYLVLCCCYIVYQFIRRYTSLSIKKISVPNADIDIDGDKSVFNDYLEEIIYFFQETEYNVVFIEDLDRFDSTHLFLKLRELNNLLNSSHMLKGDIRFVYAIKDDMFVDSGRTKFFDEIIPVIPIINPSNAADKLKEKLSVFRLDDKIPTEDLKDMAYFIKDMRLLTNIANEFHSYYDMLEVEKNHLNPTKLMGMMIYKNLYPRDFGRLPNREGILYKFFDKRNGLKDQFIKYTKNKIIKKRREELGNIKQIRQETAQHNEVELRKLYLLEIYRFLNIQLNNSIQIDGSYRNFNEIVNDKDLFDKLTDNGKKIYYGNSDYWNNHYFTNNFSKVEQSVDSNFSYKERAKAVSFDSEIINEELHNIDIIELHINIMRLSELLSKYPEVLDDEEYKKLNIPYMIQFFVVRGYLDEDYYDYISYFYNGITSDNDHDVLMKLKANQEVPYDQLIDNVKGLMQVLPKELLSTDACFINAIYDFILQNSIHYKEECDLLLDHLKESDHAVEFLEQYLKKGESYGIAFNFYVNDNINLSWEEFINIKDDESNDMIREWFKAVDLDKPFNVKINNWIKDNYQFFKQDFVYIGQQRTFNIINGVKFASLADGNSALLDYVCDNDLYEFNTNNLVILAGQYNKRQTVTVDNLNLTRILNCENNNFKQNIKEHISKAIDCFSQTAKDEDESSLLLIINNDSIPSQVKRNYIHSQVNSIDSLEDINNKEDKQIALEEEIVFPSWENILDYINTVNPDGDEILAGYISDNTLPLGAFGSAIAFNSNNILLNVILNSSIIKSDDNYKKIVNAFIGATFDKGISSDLDNHKLTILISNSIIPYRSDYTDLLRRKGDYVFGFYLEHYWTEYKNDINTNDFSVGTTLYLLNSLILSINDKELIAKNVHIDIIASNEDVATELSKLLSTNYVALPIQVLNLIIKNSTVNKYQLETANSAIQYTINRDIEEEKKLDIISSIVNSIGGHYVELLDTSKNPVFSDNIDNIKLLQQLQSCGIISSFHKDKNGLYHAYHRHEQKKQ